MVGPGVWGGELADYTDVEDCAGAEDEVLEHLDGIWSTWRSWAFLFD